MAEPVPFPPPGFDELSLDERIKYLQSLIAAQEEERARIARELHDDIGQRLFVLAVDLASVAEGSPGSLEVSRRAIELRRQLSEIASDVQALSYRLQASKLKPL